MSFECIATYCASVEISMVEKKTKKTTKKNVKRFVLNIDIMPIIHKTAYCFRESVATLSYIVRDSSLSCRNQEKTAPWTMYI